MKKILKYIVKLSLVLLMTICCGLSIGYANDLLSSKHVKNIYYDGDGITQQTIFEYVNQENKSDSPINFTGWLEKDTESVVNEDLNRSATVRALMISGDSSLVIDGPVLFADDLDGCLIDSETAYTLFGSDNVIGKEIVYGERKLTIRGLHKGNTLTIVVEAMPDSQDRIDGIAVDLSDENPETLRLLSNKYGISDEGVDNRGYYNFARFSMMILPLIILIFILVKMIKEIRNNKRKPVLAVIYLLITALLAFIFVKITKLSITIPVDMLPNKWSDFDFWTNLYKEKKELFREFLYMKKYSIDIYYIELMLKSVFFSVLTIILFFINKAVIKIKTVKKLLVSVIVLFICSFITVLRINSRYLLDCSTAMLWLLYPYFICCEFFIGPRLAKVFAEKEEIIKPKEQVTV